MENVLANPATLTPLALLGLVIVQIVQVLRAHMDAKAGRESKVDDSMAALLTKVLDQHAAASERQAVSGAAQAVAMERVAASMAEVQSHMRDTNSVLSAFSHRLEAVERQLAHAAPIPAAPVARPVGRSSRGA